MGHILSISRFITVLERRMKNDAQGKCSVLPEHTYSVTHEDNRIFE